MKDERFPNETKKPKRVFAPLPACQLCVHLSTLPILRPEKEGVFGGKAERDSLISWHYLSHFWLTAEIFLLPGRGGGNFHK